MSASLARGEITSLPFRLRTPSGIASVSRTLVRSPSLQEPAKRVAKRLPVGASCRSGPTISTRVHSGVFDKLNKVAGLRMKPPLARQGDRRCARHRDPGSAEKVGCRGKSYGADTMARLPESEPRSTTTNGARDARRGRRCRSLPCLQEGTDSRQNQRVEQLSCNDRCDNGPKQL